MLLICFFPEEKKIAVERWLWVMLSRFYQLRYGPSGNHLMGFDNLHQKIPKFQ